MKTQNMTKYIAGGAFGITVVIDMINLLSGISWGFDYWTLAEIIGLALITVSAFADIKILLSVGCGIEAAITLFSFIRYLCWGISLFSALPLLLIAAACILLLFAGFNNKTAKKLCLCAAAVSVVRMLYIVIRNIINDYGFSFYFFAFAILFTVGACSLGGLLTKQPEENSVQIPVVSQDTTQAAVDTSGNIDKLLKITALLDAGVITQEEFDAKKKQILGL